MKKNKHILLPSIIYGIIGVLLWMSFAWIQFGSFWADDACIVWLISIGITGVFLSAVCLAMFTYVLKSKKKIHFVEYRRGTEDI